MDREMIEKVLTELEQPMIDTLRTLVRIPSVKDAPQPGAPFGKPAREALDKAVEICAGLGFDCANIDGYAGHADLGEGTTQDALAVLGHLDVVPVGDNWTCEPFGAEIRDGKMYGRGTSDDKGPVVAAMYAMAAIKRLGLPLRRKIRLILGTDEESGWEDMRYYRKACGMPRSGFSPDADYPVINIEKGSIHLEIEGKLSDQGLPVIRFDTGDRPNVVPGRAEALIAGDQALADMINATDYGWSVTAEATDEGVILRTEGIPLGRQSPPKPYCTWIKSIPASTAPRMSSAGSPIMTALPGNSPRMRPISTDFWLLTAMGAEPSTRSKSSRMPKCSRILRVITVGLPVAMPR